MTISILVSVLRVKQPHTAGTASGAATTGPQTAGSRCRNA